jgi:excisionase family DNA binding protein
MGERTLTVAEIADRFGVDPHTVLGWIRSGELRAINVGRKPGARKPRWRITAEALTTFELCRTANPAPPPTRRRRQPADEIIKFY